MVKQVHVYVDIWKIVHQGQFFFSSRLFKCDPYLRLSLVQHPESSATHEQMRWKETDSIDLSRAFSPHHTGKLLYWNIRLSMINSRQEKLILLLFILKRYTDKTSDTGDQKRGSSPTVWYYFHFHNLTEVHFFSLTGVIYQIQTFQLVLNYLGISAQLFMFKISLVLEVKCFSKSRFTQLDWKTREMCSLIWGLLLLLSIYPHACTVLNVNPRHLNTITLDSDKD